MAKRKTLTPLQQQHQHQVKRIQKTLTDIRKQGRSTKQLEQELKAVLSKRPTTKSIQALKHEYSAQRIKAKAGLIRTSKGYISKEAYERKREERYRINEEKYSARQQQKTERKRQKARDYWQHHLPEVLTSKSKQQQQAHQQGTENLPRLSDLVLDRVLQMIGDATMISDNGVNRTRGTEMLHNELRRQIELYGRNAVAGAMEQLPTEVVAEMETLIKYGNDKEQNSATIARIAEAITSEILSPTIRKDIANYVDEGEEYGE